MRAIPKPAGKVLIKIGEHEATFNGEEVIKFAHSLLAAAEKSLKRAKRWKPT